MVQKTYSFYNINELKDTLQTICKDQDYNSSSGILMQVYNPRLDIDEGLMIETIKEACPKACITGITAANIAGEDVIIESRYTPKCYEEDVDTDANKEIPFVERILAFLESTSKELDSMNKELGEIAYTDQLTKIFNRWELEKKIDECLELSRQGKSYGLLFFDIDHFKRINDNFGHDMGDRALLAVVDIIKANLKEGHAFGRWGGFVILILITRIIQIDSGCFCCENYLDYIPFL